MDRLREIAEKWAEDRAMGGVYPSEHVTCFMAGYEAALREALAGAWVPVGERLPERFKSVFVYGPNCGDETGWVGGEGLWIRDNDGDGRIDNRITVTHWRPLPPPPHTKENADGE